MTLTTERQQFEEWFNEEMVLHISTSNEAVVRLMWKAWQASRELLANREAQPVACDIERIKRHALPAGECPRQSQVVLLSSLQRLLTAPPAPAVPDDVQHLRNVQELYHKQEERLFSLAQRIKGASFDKYSHTTAQAIDVLECEIFGDDGDACRAAMLAQPVSSGYKLPDDTRRMDWLVAHHVTVRKPLRYGSEAMFTAQTITDEEDDYHATKLREQIDAAMLAAAPEGGNG
ncbi:hypothetical protein ABTW51_09195 [Serratia nematodiphila]